MAWHDRTAWLIATQTLLLIRQVSRAQDRLRDLHRSVTGKLDGFKEQLEGQVCRLTEHGLESRLVRPPPTPCDAAGRSSPRRLLPLLLLLLLLLLLRFRLSIYLCHLGVPWMCPPGALLGASAKIGVVTCCVARRR